MTPPAGPSPEQWQGRRVLITGHTGFKGAWLTLWLQTLGAELAGLSDTTRPAPSLFAQAQLEQTIEHYIADVRDPQEVFRVVDEVRPDVVFHMAAQPFVRRSFQEPVETYAVNVMGTVHVLDAIRRVGGVRAVVVVTSDKCYDNIGEGRAFTEDDQIGGHDPYSNSKGCAELVTDAYRRSFFGVPGTANVASARAGNGIGGGDWGEDRLIPDIMRAALADEPVRVRSPGAVRPWQHVLNPLHGYLVLAQSLLVSDEHASAWNFGPDSADARPVSAIVERMSERWPDEVSWDVDPGPHPHEAAFLSIDSSRAYERFGWRPGWDLDTAIDATVDWFTALREGADMRAVSLRQIAAFAR